MGSRELAQPEQKEWIVYASSPGLWPLALLLKHNGAWKLNLSLELRPDLQGEGGGGGLGRCGDEDGTSNQEPWWGKYDPFEDIVHFCQPKFPFGFEWPRESMGLPGHPGTASPIHLTGGDRGAEK